MTKQSILIRLLRYTRPHSKYILGALGGAVVSVSFLLAGPILVGKAIDFIAGKGNVNFSAVFYILLLLGGSILITSLFQWTLSRCTNQIAYLTVKDLRMDLFQKMNTMPLKYIDNHSHGDMMSRIVNDVDQVSDGLIQGITQLFTGSVTILGTLIFMLSVDPVTAAVVVLITPLSIFVASFIAKMSHKLFRQQSAAQGELSGFVEEMVSNQKIVKSFGHEEENIEQFKEINARLYRCGIHSQFYSSLSNPSTRFVNSLVYAAAGVVGALRVISGLITIGDVSCFLSYANQYTKPFNEVTGVLTQLQTAFASAQRIFAVLDQASETADPPDAVQMESCSGRVDFKQVSFSYQPDRELLKNISLSVKTGQKIAIVGPTGCGKTTLINLLMRFYDVDQGAILVDGVDIRRFARNNLRSQFGMVLQETWLQTATVRENIAYGKPDASMEEVVSAAKSAYADSFIRRLEKGYDTVISAEGTGLSQGQKQLLCIARAMLADAPILILDEATSSIDTMTEQRVQKAFARLTKGKTSFVVAHRLSTIKEADLILVMKEGNIIEQGTHDSLLNQKGFYAQLYYSQFTAGK